MKAILFLTMCMALTTLGSAQDTLFVKGGIVHPVQIIDQNERHIVVKNEDNRRAKVPLDIIERIFTCNIEEDGISEVTGTRAILTEFQRIGKVENGFHAGARLIYTDSLYYIVIRVPEYLGCVNKNESEVQIITESGIRMAFRHVGEKQCDGCSHELITLFLYGNLEDIKDEDMQPMQTNVLNILKKEKIAHLRIYGSELHTDVELTEQGKYFIRDGIICISRALDN